MPLLRRKSSDLVGDAVTEVNAATESDDAAADATTVAGSRSKAYTPSKKELGKVTPRRKEAGARRVEPPPANRREAYRRLREKSRAERLEARQGMLQGDDKFMLARDRGPARALIRDIVDSRRNVGTWFFVGALVVIIGSSGAMPVAVRAASNLLWLLLALAVIVDSIVLSRKVKRMVRERHPEAATRGNSFYAIMRAISFRRMRMPKPRVKVGAKI